MPTEPVRLAQSDIEHLLDLVRAKYPGWEDFNHPQFVGDEIGYKRAASSKAQQLLGRQQFDQALKSGTYDELVTGLETVANATNLLYRSVPRQGDLGILYQDNLDRRGFFTALRELLHGEGETLERLERYLAFVHDHGLPSKWTFPTYYLFLLHPDSEIFVKPSATTAALQLLGLGRTIWGVPDSATYALIRDSAAALKDALAPYQPADMIDIQSLLWVAYAPDAGSLLTPAMIRELRDLIPEFARDYLASDDGRRHREAHRNARQQAPLNFERARAARDASEDYTSLVLDGLLPHADTRNNRARGAWISPAPAVTKDVRQWFEGAGWVQARDWPEIARTILGFVERCVGNPEALEDACEEFISNPLTKGFRAGMLTPMLNALRPEAFLVINNKSRRLINHLARTKYGQGQLNEYPAVNRTGFQLVRELEPLLGAAGAPDSWNVGDVFDAFAHWMVAIKDYAFGQHYWKVAPGEDAAYWQDCLDGGFIAMGWGELGDVTDMTKQEFEARAGEVIASHPKWTKRGLLQVWRFSRIKEGDRIVANRGTKAVCGMGTVTGPYFYDSHGGELSHRLPVEWSDTTLRKVDEEGWRRTVVQLDRQKFEQILLETGPVPPPITPTPGDKNLAYPLTVLADECGLPEALLERWVRAVERKYQAILYGPPGTGKTYLAQRLARHLIGGRTGFNELVQFHPAYSYEDFMQGIRPRRMPDGSLTYDLVAGRFLDFCERARSLDDEGRAVLIVDEINRANLSRVFGELMYLLEYRDQDIPLAGGGRFRIPGNVRVLGTMNTADRSIALVDHALRRRFAFLELRPQYGALTHYHETHVTGFDPAGLIGVMRELNLEIDDPHFALGIAYFLREDVVDQIEDIWRMEVEPYLEEYFFDRKQKKMAFDWDKVGHRILKAQ